MKKPRLSQPALRAAASAGSARIAVLSSTPTANGKKMTPQEREQLTKFAHKRADEWFNEMCKKEGASLDNQLLYMGDFASRINTRIYEITVMRLIFADSLLLPKGEEDEE